jgi:hypothetical protein
MKKIVVVLALMSAVTVGCKKDGEGGGGGGAAAGGDIGVKECDDYIAKYSACIAKMAPEAKTAMEGAFKQTKDAWKQAAATPEGKTGLANACKAASDAIKATCP